MSSVSLKEKCTTIYQSSNKKKKISLFLNLKYFFLVHNKTPKITQGRNRVTLGQAVDLRKFLLQLRPVCSLTRRFLVSVRQICSVTRQTVSQKCQYEQLPENKLCSLPGLRVLGCLLGWGQDRRAPWAALAQQL